MKYANTLQNPSIIRYNYTIIVNMEKNLHIMVPINFARVLWIRIQSNLIHTVKTQPLIAHNNKKETCELVVQFGTTVVYI